jgi:pheromone a factor receptor
MMVFIGAYHVIAVRFIIGIQVAVPAAILCINRRLYLLASPPSIVIPSKADKNRELIIDLVIGIGLPIIVMALCLSFNLSLYLCGSSIFSAFLFLASRFIIVEDYGCSYAAYKTWVPLVIINIPPVLLELICGVYGCLSIRAYYNRSKLNETHNVLNPDRYIRLMCFSALDLLTGIPITVYFLYDNAVGLVPFPGITQDQFSLLPGYQLPAVEWRANMVTELDFELSRWIMVYVAFVFFAIFGFTPESRNNYRAMLHFVVQVFVKITGIKSRPGNKAEGCVTSLFFLFFV